MKNHFRVESLILVIFVSCLIVSNILATKIFDFFGYYLPAGILVFPITYIIGDVVTEVFGYKTMKRFVFLGFIANIITVTFIAISLNLTPAPFWEKQEHYLSILSQTPQILLGSLLGYLLGSLSNSWSMEKIKTLTKGKLLWFRTIVSTIIGEGIDTIIFILVAFSFIIDFPHLMQMIIVQWIFKVAYETIATPITYLIISKVRSSITKGYEVSI